MPYIQRITLFPIKSLDGVEVKTATISAGGALLDDRRYAMVDADGRFVNGKRTAAVHGLRSHYDLSERTVELSIQDANESRVFHLDRERDAMAQWLSAFFGFSVRLVEAADKGFPDDDVYPGPTLVSSGTLEAVAGWFDGLETGDLRRRLRTNIEIGGVEPFWEDRLFAAKGVPVPFKLGEVRMEGGNPCQRCVVPTRDPLTGAVFPGFAKRFVEHRSASLAPWAERSRFDHFYRLCVNTTVVDGQAGMEIRLQDALSV
jgi:uncharacterized protein YcbX